MDEMDRVKQELMSYSYEENKEKLVNKLGEAVEDIDVDACEIVVKQLLDIIGEDCNGGTV